MDKFEAKYTICSKSLGTAQNTDRYAEVRYLTVTCVGGEEISGWLAVTACCRELAVGLPLDMPCNCADPCPALLLLQ